MSRRANGTGSIGTRPDGALVVRCPDPNTGQRVKRIVQRADRGDGSGRPETPSQHRKRAEQALAELRRQLAQPSTLRERWTVSRYFEERYMPSVEPRLRARTSESYRLEFERYLRPHVGSIELAKLGVDEIDQLDRTLADRGLSLTVRRKSRGLLSRVCKHAVSKGRLRYNPCSDADRFAVDDRDRTRDVMQPEEVARLLAAARDGEGGVWLAPIALLALTGMRRGELLGLSWDSVDLDAGSVAVVRSMATLKNGRNVLGPTKTSGSRRVLTLTPALVGALRAHRARVVEWQLRAGEAWIDSVVDEAGEAVSLVCVDEAGQSLMPHRVNDALGRLAAVAGVSHVTPHGLRHAAASLMIEQGTDIASVAGTLGHSSPATTLSVYSHALRRSVARATSAIADAVGAW